MMFQYTFYFLWTSCGMYFNDSVEYRLYITHDWISSCYGNRTFVGINFQSLHSGFWSVSLMGRFNRRNVTYGKSFRKKSGKWKGRLVRYSYLNGRKSTKTLTLVRRRKWFYFYYSVLLWLCRLGYWFSTRTI